MNNIKDTPRPTSITFQGDSLTFIIRKGKKVHKWPGERHRSRLLGFCLEQGYGRVERGKDLTIYRNWR